MAFLLVLIQLASGAAAITGTVLDPSGTPVAGARVTVAGAAVAITATDGTFTIAPSALPATLTVGAPGFAQRLIHLSGRTQPPLHIVLQPHGITETLTVTGRAGARVSRPAAVTVLDAESLATTPAMTLDEQLRAVPGFSLFRRSSSRVANPTTQGVTLRGMAATGASRATVVADGNTLNDPFGGWIYWNRIPAAAIERVEVARGGASDVYGSDAMGGAIRIETAAAGTRIFADGGQDATARLSAFTGHQIGAFTVRGGAERFTTDGYRVVEPAARGRVDVNAWSRHSTAIVSAGTRRVDVRASYFSERRGNGTAVQANATVARDVAIGARGGAWNGFWSARAGFASQGYDQTFSAIAIDRSVERLTTGQRVDSTTATAAAEWFRGWPAVTFFAAASARSASAEIIEQGYPTTLAVAPFVQDARQRTGSLVAQVSWAASPRVTISGGGRGEIWATRHVQEERKRGIVFFVPRASVAFRSSPELTLRVSVQDSYRLPTMNELYRGFQVGSVYTYANPDLDPEESYGIDASALVTRGAVVARATAFASRVKDAIVNVTLDATPTIIERERGNAGTIRAAGLELESEVRMGRGLSLTAAGAFISSMFTSGELDGRRVPQVPRFQASAGLRSSWSRASAAFDWRYVSSQWDDDRNRFRLDAASIADARVGWLPRRGIEVFAAVENVFDAEQDVGRTPVRTVGLPRTARVGLRLSISD